MTKYDFETVWRHIQKAGMEPDDWPVMVGGRFLSRSPIDFLTPWFADRRDMPWRLWEHSDGIAWGQVRDSRPPRETPLLRAELFGPDGHLSLRRDGADRWQWRFVGPADAALPAGLDATPWGSGPGAVLRRYQEKAILWGKEIRKQEGDRATGIGLWWDDRVGAARLAYPPHLSGIERVYLHFDRYTQAGHTVFVWYKGLGDDKKVQPWLQQ